MFQNSEQTILGYMHALLYSRRREAGGGGGGEGAGVAQSCGD